MSKMNEMNGAMDRVKEMQRKFNVDVSTVINPVFANKTGLQNWCKIDIAKMIASTPSPTNSHNSAGCITANIILLRIYFPMTPTKSNGAFLSIPRGMVLIITCLFI